MSKIKLIMSNGQEHIIEGDKESIAKELDASKEIVNINGIYINPRHVVEIKEEFEHTMMPDITGVKVNW